MEIEKRQISLDTETTGLNYKNGDRIVEIGAVEIINNKKTGKVLHFLINPQKEVSKEAFEVHGHSNEKLKDCPLFKDIVDEFLKFIENTEVVIHNAKFDIGMLDAELERINKGKLWDYIKNVIDSFELDKRLFAEEKKHSLDAICKRFEIDTSHRVLHGALLDADLLADVFIKINELHSSEDIAADVEQKNWERPEIKRYLDMNLKKIELNEVEQNNHNQYLIDMENETKVVPIFNKKTSMVLK